MISNIISNIISYHLFARNVMQLHNDS